jgi:ribosomal protein L32
VKGDTHPVFELIGFVEKDLANVRARLTELRAHLASAGLEPVVLPSCKYCGALHLPPTVTLEEHYRNIHGVDEP